MIKENIPCRLLWQSEQDHIYFRLQAKTREDEYVALGELRLTHLHIFFVLCIEKHTESILIMYIDTFYLLCCVQDSSPLRLGRWRQTC